MAESGKAGRAGGPRWLKPACEYGPLVVFFGAYSVWEIYAATAALMAATVVAVAAALIIERRVPILPLVTALLVGVFGGLTLFFQDETFIKMKPTIVQLMFAAVLFGAHAFNLRLLPKLFGRGIRMKDRGWQILEFRLALFFLAMAGLNELVWRTQSTDFWVGFKVFGLTALTLAFFATQLPLIYRNHLPEEAEKEEAGAQ